MEWINKTDRLPDRDSEYPETSVYVLVTVGELIGIGQYYFNMEYWYYTLTERYDTTGNEITHWAYLPELPK